MPVAALAEEALLVAGVQGEETEASAVEVGKPWGVASKSQQQLWAELAAPPLPWG